MADTVQGEATNGWVAEAFRVSGSVLLHSPYSSSGRNRVLFFSDPLRYIVASAPGELAGAFAEVADALAAGHYLAGYLTYEAGLALHGIAGAPLPVSEPLLCFGVYHTPQYADATLPPAGRATTGQLHLAPMPALSRSHYGQQIAQLQRWIGAGDIYQANYTVPLRGRTHEAPEAIYRALLQEQPAAYAAILRLEPSSVTPPTILSFSPELFFRTSARGDILTRPMKGTLARTEDPETDAQGAAWLASDPKNRAEHVMIVDLLRNDLGRICQTGSVHAGNLFAVQSLPTVHQMVSDVSGRLRPGTTPLDVFRALFPSGSITGAPKLRAVQLLQQVENVPRGAYTGAIGYLAPNGESCFSVGIRTLELRPWREQYEVTCGVGGGIVADSTAPAEYAEAMLKAAFIRRASKPLECIETVLSQDREMRWLESHLDRLQRTAEALAIPFNRDGIREQVLHCAKALPAGPQRIRMALQASGELRIRTEPLSTWPNTLRVRIASTPSHMGDPALAYKTNIREAYDRELQAANQAGFDESLFLNDAGLLTEGCLTNLFFVRDGRMLTPYVECGVLPGILRAHLLRCQLIEESLLPAGELERCEALILGNSLRGIYPVHALQIAPDRTLTLDPQAAQPYVDRLRQVFTASRS